MKNKNFSWWFIFILLCIWQLPQFLVSLIMMIFLGQLDVVADRHFNFCFRGKNMSGGISLGPFAFVSNYSAKKQETIAHEVDGHTVQSKLFGPLYLLIIGIPSLVHAWFHDYHKSCYYDYWCERWANNLAKLEVDENCNLKFKESKGE